MEDEEKKNNSWLKIRILTKHSLNLILGYFSKIFFTEIILIKLNDYLEVNRWTGKVHMRPSVLCKKFKGKDIKEIKILIKYAFISGFESIQYNSDKLIFAHRKEISFDTHNYILTKFEDINKYNNLNKQLSEIEYTKKEDDSAKYRRVVENLAVYKLRNLLKMKSYEIEELIETKNKGIVTIQIEDISKISKHLRNPGEIRRNKIKEKNEISEKKSGLKAQEEPHQKKYGGAKLKKEKGATSKNKLYIGIFLGMLFGLIGPIIINELYKPSIYRVSYLTLWDAADLLQYYGTLLGAVATIIAVVWTIDFSKKSADRNKIDNINAEYRKLGIDTCLKLMDILDIQMFEKYDKKTTTLNYKEQDIINELGQTSDEMRDLINNFRRIYRGQKDELEEFSNWYFHEIKKFIENHSDEAKKNITYDYRASRDDAKRLRNEHRAKYEEVKLFILETLTMYNVQK
ncbi:MAG: hypothetical protein CVU99_02335 [Firmicutes bacterium HGW-Firmicutes-4]|nr:MAG: hypothetical protein CVU99_02335 [Firmicutes bacterium HGW-Firmicutes-4]